MTIHRHGRAETRGIHAGGTDVAAATGGATFGVAGVGAGAGGAATIFGPSKLGGGRCAISGWFGGPDEQPVANADSPPNINRRESALRCAILGPAVELSPTPPAPSGRPSRRRRRPCSLFLSDVRPQFQQSSHKNRCGTAIARSRSLSDASPTPYPPLNPHSRQPLASAKPFAPSG